MGLSEGGLATARPMNSTAHPAIPKTNPEKPRQARRGRLEDGTGYLVARMRWEAIVRREGPYFTLQVQDTGESDNNSAEGERNASTEDHSPRQTIVPSSQAARRRSAADARPHSLTRPGMGCSARSFPVAASRTCTYPSEPCRLPPPR